MTELKTSVTQSGATAGGPKLLIVTRDASRVDAIRVGLGQTSLLGATLYVAPNLQEALGYLAVEARPGSVDAVIIDADGSVEDLVIGLRQIAGRVRGIGVVVMRADRAPGTVMALEQVGVHDVVPNEPIDHDRLALAVRGAVRIARVERELHDQKVEMEHQVEEAQALTEELEQANEHLQEANADVRRSEDRYRALVEASTQLVWNTDAKGMIVDLPLWRSLTGQTVDEVRGTGWLNALHPDDRARSADVWWNAFNSRRVYQNEYRLRLADGNYRWFRARGVPVLDERREVREWVGTLNDIEDEKRAEDARREETSLIETLNDIAGVLTSELDLERIVQTVTDAATALTGAQFGAFFYNVTDKHGDKYTLYTLSGVPRSAFENFGHPRATPVFAPTFYGTGIVRSDDITRDPRYGHMGPHYGMPKGHLPVRSYLAVPVISRSGDVIGGLFFGHSDTAVFTSRAERLALGIASSAAVAMDNARLYEAERRARGDAEVANKAKADFLASMSHELRTPLNAIGGYAALLAEGIRGPVTGDQLADLERIRQNQHHLLSLINDILNFAKVEAGRVQFEVRPVDVHVALGQLEALIAPQLLERKIRYEYRPCATNSIAIVDPDRMQQIMLNLLSNAVKFTPTGGTVIVSCISAEKTVKVSVEDSGVGIPADKLEAIFEPFVQLDRGRAATSGTGLGLSISRDLARAMGGDIAVESTPDVGSRFTLTLPRDLAGMGQRQ